MSVGEGEGEKGGEGMYNHMRCVVLGLPKPTAEVHCQGWRWLLTVLDNLVGTFQEKCLVGGHLVEHHLLYGGLATPAGEGRLCCHPRAAAMQPAYLRRPMSKILGLLLAPTAVPSTSSSAAP